MGMFSNVKNAGGYVFNFKVSSWLGVDQIKATTKNIASLGRNVVTPEQADYVETFDDALMRLGITNEVLQQRVKEFNRLMIIFIFVAAAIFSYSVFIVFKHKNIMGFIMGFAITLYALTHAFRYHFWVYQIKHKKLGCTLREWFLEKD